MNRWSHFCFESGLFFYPLFLSRSSVIEPSFPQSGQSGLISFFTFCIWGRIRISMNLANTFHLSRYGPFLSFLSFLFFLFTAAGGSSGPSGSPQTLLLSAGALLFSSSQFYPLMLQEVRRPLSAGLPSYTSRQDPPFPVSPCTGQSLLSFFEKPWWFPFPTPVARIGTLDDLKAKTKHGSAVHLQCAPVPVFLFAPFFPIFSILHPSSAGCYPSPQESPAVFDGRGTLIFPCELERLRIQRSLRWFLPTRRFSWVSPGYSPAEGPLSGSNSASGIVLGAGVFPFPAIVPPRVPSTDLPPQTETPLVGYPRGTVLHRQNLLSSAEVRRFCFSPPLFLQFL